MKWAPKVSKNLWNVMSVALELPSSEWSTFHPHLCISYQCIWGWQLTFTKTLPQMSFHLYFLLLLFRMTLLTAGALTDPRLPATASNVCTTDARLGGVGRMLPPNKNPGYAGDIRTIRDCWNRPWTVCTRDPVKTILSDRLLIKLPSGVTIDNRKNNWSWPICTT